MRPIRLCILTAALAISGHAASLGVTIPLHAIAHPVATFHSIPADQRLMLITDAVLQNANMVDYATTYRALINPPAGSLHYCEGNHLLQQANGCDINAPRFTGVKIGAAALGIAEWIPVWAHKASPTYIRTVTIINASAGAALAAVDVNNIIQLSK